MSLVFATTGDQNWNDPVVLGDNPTFSGAALTFADDVTVAGFALTADTTEAITISGGVTATTTGSVSLTTDRNIVMNSGSSIATVDGNVTLSANQQPSATSGDFDGITISGDLTTSGTGDILITGRSGDDLANHGVRTNGS